MTDLLDGAVAVLLFGILNAILIARLGSRQPSSEGAFLARAYTTTLLLRAVLAILINVFAADSVFAGAFWGDSGTYDAAGHALARHWQGDSARTSLTQMLSGYGFVYIVGAIYYFLGRNQRLVQFEVEGGVDVDGGSAGERGYKQGPGETGLGGAQGLQTEEQKRQDGRRPEESGEQAAFRQKL